MTAPDDLALLDRWRAGEEAAGQALFQRYFDSIFRFFESKCEAEAEDLVQATFLACLHAKQQFRKEASFRTYLFTIARHELYRTLSRRRRDGERLDFEVSSIAELVSTPGTRMARDQEHRRLLETLQRLPVEQQMLLELHYWEGLGIAELGEVFEATSETIRTRLHRARKALRAKLERSAPENLEALDTWAKGFSAK